MKCFVWAAFLAAASWGVEADGQVAANAVPTAVVCVRDALGFAVPGATVTRGGPVPGAAPTAGLGGVKLGPVMTPTGRDGCATVSVARPEYARGVLSAERAGFALQTVAEPSPGETVYITLQPEGARASVTVTADRGLAGVDDQATSVVVLDQGQLAAPPALSLDDRLHQVAGFQLYRRTSSWTANPTTEGVSLRGLGSTAASRTLVESDEVPLNDPFGGWIHWDEIPTLAIVDVQVVRGGAADLYGSSAIGGVIAIDPVTPGSVAPVQVDADALGATENSAEGDLLVSGAVAGTQVLAAGSGVDTGGYVTTAPAARGRVDVPSNVAEESGRVELRRAFDGASGGPSAGQQGRKAGAGGPQGDVFLRGNVLNEARSNGTPDQTNGTRLWRYSGGGDVDAGLGHAALRVFGDREAYRQSFSSIAANRNSEVLTRLQRVPTDEFGFSAQGSRGFGHALTGGVGLDLRDIRATDAESPVSAGVASSTTDISAHQRDLGGYLEAIWQPRGWSVAGSVRVDSFRTFDGRQTATNTRTVVSEPETDEVLASPHLGVVRQLPHGLALTGSGFRAFRGPTMNELYRTGQVGQQLTEANPALLAERATGFEFGAEMTDVQRHGRSLGRVRASYFWTEVNRPISAVLLLQTATTQTLQRQNLGQIRSRGLSLEAATARWRGLDASVGYQLAVATVTAFNTSSAVQANLRGNWIPEVPRNLATATVNQVLPRVADLHLIASYTGREYDDANNQFLLHPYPRIDVSADRALTWRGLRGLGVYAGAQNLLNRTIDAGRTPILTLAAPRLVQGGLRYSFHQ